MKYNFIEIGTSDFDTLVQSSNEDTIGISIEPIPLYINSLPNKLNVIKINAAIGEEDGTALVYYIHPDDILKLNLPHWVKGCNSINSPHPTVLNMLGDKYQDVATIEEIKVISFKTLFETYNISEVDHIKMDTEGNDSKFLKSLYDYLIKHPDIKIHSILFESNSLCSPEDVQETIRIYESLGFKTEYSDHDTLLKYYGK